MSIDKRLALIGGAGTMGTAVVRGLLQAEAVAPEQIVVTARHERSFEHLRQYHVRLTTDNIDAVQGADVILLCVHPDQVAGVVEEVKPSLVAEPLILSLATGIPTARIEALVGELAPVVRATPNLAAVVGASITVVCAGRLAEETHLELAEEIFGTVGEVERLDERHMNACTALVGCGPAFVFKCIEALAEGGVKMGLPRMASRRMAAQMMLGASSLVLITGEHPAALKDQVTTPGGCTIDGITKLEERGLPIALIEAVETSALKAAKLFDS